MTAAGLPADEHVHRQLEITVLTQLRDGLSLVNANMVRMNDKLDQTHERVVALQAAKFDEQIAAVVDDTKEDLEKAREAFQRQIDDLKKAGEDREHRIRVQDAQIARLGLGMAIAGSIATASATAAIALAISRVFGGGA